MNELDYQGYYQLAEIIPIRPELASPAVQEKPSLLTKINYFCGQAARIVIEGLFSDEFD
ncbi:MAG: hypothetical protein ACREGA_03380 [Candidatus Saccharimonadales bacterium]